MKVWDAQRKAIMGNMEDALVFTSTEQSKFYITEDYQTRHLSDSTHLFSEAVILTIVPSIY